MDGFSPIHGCGVSGSSGSGGGDSGCVWKIILFFLVAAHFVILATGGYTDTLDPPSVHDIPVAESTEAAN